MRAVNCTGVKGDWGLGSQEWDTPSKGAHPLHPPQPLTLKMMVMAEPGLSVHVGLLSAAGSVGTSLGHLYPSDPPQHLTLDPMPVTFPPLARRGFGTHFWFTVLLECPAKPSGTD